jgi:hypothetical protein
METLVDERNDTHEPYLYSLFCQIKSMTNVDASGIQCSPCPPN